MILKDTLCERFVDFARDIFGASAGQVIPLHAPTFGNTEFDFVQEALHSTFVSTAGYHADQFAKEISDYTGAPFAMPVVSGTAALHLALLGVGVVPGSIVLTQALSFVATGNAIKYCQADPIFLDVENDTLGMDPVQLEVYLTENCEVRDDGSVWTKGSKRRVAACLPVHIFGNPCLIFEIKKICDAWGLPLVEDAAESLGSLEAGVHTGTIGTAGVYSFNGNKLITTGAGGCVVTKDENLARKISHLANVSKVSVVDSFEVIHDSIGFNYKMPALNAALGLGQLKSIGSKIGAKRKIHEAYRNWCADADVELVTHRVSSNPNFWLNTIRLEAVEDRTRWLSCTNREGVQTRPLWRPMNEYPQFEGCECAPLPVTKALSQLLLSVPSSPGV